jgi:TonB family protein
MLKRVLPALLGAALLTGAALADTPPTLGGIKECDGPRLPEGGHTTVGFKVTAAGAAEDFKVIESSGNTDSDERVVKCVAGYSWKPATHDGVAVDGTTTFTFNFGQRIADMEDGPRKAFHVLERDADRRCRKLYPIDPRFDLGGQPITLVAVARLKSGEIVTKVMQSAGAKADAKAVKCVTELVKGHDDLPAEFVRTISVDWSHR